MQILRVGYKRVLGLASIVLILVNILILVAGVKPAYAATYLSLKWTANIGAQTAIGPLAADLNGDGSLEIVVSGGTNITALNGTDGSVLWTVNPGGIGLHSPFEIADLNNDNLPEIIVAAGSALALYGTNGSVYWRNTAAPADGHFPTVADIDGYGYATVFVNSGSGPYQGYDYITSLTYDGKILHKTLCWHPCYGGLTIGDTDFDGVFELYQGDRSQNYNPAEDPYKYGGWGVRKLDAHTLTPIWNDSTILCSSHCPMLADVDKDGILDVIVADQGNNGAAVLRSSNGSVLTTGGKYRKGSIGSVCHSQPSIYDLDGDGNLEIMTCSGSNPVIWDLYQWKLDATLPRSAGEPPKVGDVTGDGKMDIILSSGGSIYIYSYNATSNQYDQVDYVSGLTGASAFTLVQDVDGDGLNELVVTSGSSSGPVYCFNTPAPAPTPLPRTNCQFYSERKCGAAEYVPPVGPSKPALTYEQPADGSTVQPLNPKLSVRAVDFQGDLMNITFRTNTTGTWENIASYTNVGNGVYNATPTNMNAYNTTYYWGVYAVDSGSGNASWRTYKFTTYEPAPWWDTRWVYRKPITIDKNKISANLTDFPVLIQLTDSDLASKAHSEGLDIAFTDYDGNKLDHELEYYEGTTGELVAWVRVPNLSSTANTTLYMYYGSDLTGGENASAVWDSDFLAVHHLSETSGTAYDSTPNNNDGTPFGGLNQDAVGKINGADYFDAVDDYLRLPQVFTSETEFTLEAWFYSDGTLSLPQYIVSQWSETIVNGTPVDTGAHLNIYANATLQMLINENRSAAGVSLGTWYYVAGTFNGSAARLYLNGAPASTFIANLTWPDENMFIGDRSDHQRKFHGLIDEVRVSRTPRSAGWIQTCYSNQLDPSSFYNILGEEHISLPEAPIVRYPDPADGSVDVSVSMSELTFNLLDHQGDLMNYTVTTSPNIGSASGINVDDGTHTVGVSGLQYSASYAWKVSVTDGTHWTNVTYMFTTTQAPWPWWNTQWTYRKPVTIDHSKIASNLTGFPILINITDADLASKAQNDGDDLVFTDHDGNRLSHEMEYFDGETGYLVAWVKIPELSSISDTQIYMYYGNPTVSNQESAAAVWDSNFLAVHHLSETSGTCYDSTANHKDGTPYGSPNQNVTGWIDGADHFDGVDDQIRLVKVFSTETQFTMEAWIYAQTGARYFLSQWNNNSGAFIQVSATGTGIEWYIDGASAGSTGISLNTWYYVVATYDGSTARLYLNAGTAINKASVAPNWPSENTYIGDRSEGSRQFHGTIDEVRLSNIARSDFWIQTCYNNQIYPSSFSTVGGEQKSPTTSILITPKYNDATIDQDYVAHVEVAYATDLYGWEFQLQYDPTILDITSVSIVSGGLEEPTNIFYNLVDEVNGRLWWAVSTAYPTNAGITYSQHAIFEINFHTIGPGTSQLGLYGTNLGDSLGSSIAHTVVNGTVTVTGAYPDLETVSISVLDQGCSIYAVDTYVNGSDYYYPTEVNIHNEGATAAGAFYARLEVYWINGSLLESTTEIVVSGLAEGANTTVNFTAAFHPLHTGFYRLTATADSHDEIVEADETNNAFVLDEVMVTVIGDVNGDREVNILDGVTLSLAWASTPPNPPWNIRADVNHDGNVDILDGVRVGTHWGASW